MKLIFELNHPKHYYQFRFLINYYKSNGDIVLILARDKDVLLNVLDEEGHDYQIFGKHGKGIFSKIAFLPKLLLSYLNITRKFKADYILSKASIYPVLLKPFINAKIVISPDSEVVWLTKKIVAPLANIIITPNTYQLNHGKNHKRIDGFFEETYLSPLSFIPDSKYINEYNLKSPFFVLRFISWNANHDIGQWGFSDKQKIYLCDLLSKYGQVLISAERNKIPKEIEKYAIQIPPSKIHHILYFSNIYIGDSQTMATEASLLGTPAFRYNSFVGENDMSNFIILEKTLNILRNFSNFDDLCEAVTNILNDNNSKKDWLQKREDYFRNKKDINKQISDIILNK